MNLAPQPRPTAFFSRTYDETLQLLYEARAALSSGLPQQRPGGGDPASPADALASTMASMRLTTLLMQAMAWLLAQRAVHAGEISREEACSERFALERDPPGLSDLLPAESVSLPKGLADLLQRSRQLYVRISRLDDLMRRDLATNSAC